MKIILMIVSILTLTIFFYSQLLSHASSILISDFNVNDENWSIVGGLITHSLKNGNPNGYIILKDTKANHEMLLSAPETFHGDLSGFIGGNISFDAKLLFKTGSEVLNFGTIEISNGNNKANLDIADTALSRDRFFRYSASLSAIEWNLSEEEWREILSNVTSINIVIEGFTLVTEEIGFDNFIISNRCNDLEWHEYNGKEYALTENFGSWQEAQTEANSCGGNLVTINDIEENNWLTQSFTNTFSRANPGNENHSIAWIGYYYNTQSETWEWVNGEPVTYTNSHELFSQEGKFAYLYLNPSSFKNLWNANPTHNNNSDDNPKGIIERTISECISKDIFYQAIKAERQKWDVNNDNLIGLEEAINALQITSGLKKESTAD